MNIPVEMTVEQIFERMLTGLVGEPKAKAVLQTMKVLNLRVVAAEKQNGNQQT